MLKYFRKPVEIAANDLKNQIMNKTIYTRQIIKAQNSVLFTGITPIEPKGLIRLKQWTSNKLFLNITTHDKHEIHIGAMMKKDEANKDCYWKNGPNDYYFARKPWWQDTNHEILSPKFEEDIDGNITCVVPEKLRGGNRILYDLRENGMYHITIPNDVDLETDLLNADIGYNSARRTKLSVDCAKVNICGDSGCSVDSRQSWDYYSYGGKDDPMTKLKTNGSVILDINKAIQGQDLTNIHVWATIKK